MTEAITCESPRILQDSSMYDGVQVRSLMYLVPITMLPGRTTPIRLPEDDGTAERAAGYPFLPIIRAGKGVPTNLIGFWVLRNRRTAMETLTSLQARGLVTSRTGGRDGKGKYWKATEKGKALCDRLVESHKADPSAFPYGLDGFDNDGYDRFGVNVNGYTKTGEYVGIHHIFRCYYGDSYNA